MSLKEFAKYRSRSLDKSKRRRSNSESSLSSSERRHRGKKPGHTRQVKKKHKNYDTDKSSSDLRKRQKKSKHKHDKKKKKEKKHKLRKVEDNKSINKPSKGTERKNKPDVNDIQGPSVQDMYVQPQKRSMVPMTREEYELQQSKVRRVYDPDTGRHRLIKGNGQVIEEIVSYDRHKMINKIATLGDGASFQANLAQKHKFP